MLSEVELRKEYFEEETWQEYDPYWKGHETLRIHDRICLDIGDLLNGDECHSRRSTPDAGRCLPDLGAQA